MVKTKRLALLTGLVACAALFLAGCSGLDDLRVINNYPFAVRVRDENGKVLGQTAAKSTETFSGRAGYKGHNLDGATFGNADTGSRLGTIHGDDANVSQETKDGRFGTKVWTVTLGGPSAARTSDKINNGLQIGIFLGAALLAAGSIGNRFKRPRPH